MAAAQSPTAGVVSVAEIVVKGGEAGTLDGVPNRLDGERGELRLYTRRVITGAARRRTAVF